MRVVGCFDHEGALRGGWGRIEEDGHSLNGWFAVFAMRHTGEFDLQSGIPDWNISIGPKIEESNWPDVSGSGAIAGFAKIKQKHA